MACVLGSKERARSSSRDPQERVSPHPSSLIRPLYPIHQYPFHISRYKVSLQQSSEKKKLLSGIYFPPTPVLDLVSLERTTTRRVKGPRDPSLPTSPCPSCPLLQKPRTSQSLLRSLSLLLLPLSPPPHTRPTRLHLPREHAWVTQCGSNDAIPNRVLHPT